jgi:hypothetical protein
LTLGQVHRDIEGDLNVDEFLLATAYPRVGAIYPKAKLSAVERYLIGREDQADTGSQDGSLALRAEGDVNRVGENI